MNPDNHRADLFSLPAGIDTRYLTNRQPRIISIGPNIVVRPSRDDFVVWSPVLRQNLILKLVEALFLLKFSGGRSVDQLWPELIAIQKLGDSNTGTQATDLTTYLWIEKFLLQGLLAEEMLIAHDQLAGVHFSQHSSQSQALFDVWLGANRSVQLKHLPYYDFLRRPEEPNAGRALYQFWDALLGENDPPGEGLLNGHKARAQALLHLLDEYSTCDSPQQKALETPLPVCLRPDGGIALLENAELASVALQLGLALRVRLLQPVDFLGKLVELPSEFFGTMRGNIPYQSIFFGGQEVIRGRRRDLYERLEKIRVEDLKGKTVLDLGCNIGMNCSLAVERGARMATGIDLPEFADAATRLHSFLGSPCRFLARDLNHEVVDVGDYDTVFLFAVLGHLDSLEGLLRTIKSCNAKTVYVETHCDLQDQGDLEGFLRSPIFRGVDFLGYSQDNLVRQEKTRRLYRCQIAEGVPAMIGKT